MQMILYVSSLLMLLTLMTYGRLESFRRASFLQIGFEKYMQEAERQYVNKESEKRYNSTVATHQEKNQQKEQERNLASSKLSFRLFIDKNERDTYPEKFEHHFILARRLMQVLYSDQPFYQELVKKRPDFLNEILSAIKSETGERSKKGKIKKIEELSAIELGDMELNAAFNKMLEGTVEKRARSKRTDEELLTFKPKEGCYSLLNFITIKGKMLTIRVYLASAQLLMAIYGNPDIVKEILTHRADLYSKVKKEILQEEDAKEEFYHFCSRYYPCIPESMLNFGVSKTNPKNYE